MVLVSLHINASLGRVLLSWCCLYAESCLLFIVCRGLKQGCFVRAQVQAVWSGQLLSGGKQLGRGDLMVAAAKRYLNIHGFVQ